jgi:SAM-dependent methyltransferase
VSDRCRDLTGRRVPETISRVVHPEVLRLLGPVDGRSVLDVGCGLGALARKLAARGAEVSGIDASLRAIEMARRDAKEARIEPPPQFEVGDAHDPAAYPDRDYHAATLVLSLQSMERPAVVLRNIAGALRPGGRLVIALYHPCFRIPGSASWGWDPGDRIRFRRVDRYLTPHRGEGEPAPERGQFERPPEFHWPLERLFRALRSAGFAVVDLVEPPGEVAGEGRGEGVRAAREIPLFLILLARKSGRRSRLATRMSDRSG